MKSPREWILDYIDSLRQSQFYGRITLEFREGNIFLVRREETIKPPQADIRDTANSGVKRSNQ